MTTRLTIAAIIFALGTAGAWYVMHTIGERDDLAIEVATQKAMIQRQGLELFAAREEARLTQAAFERAQRDDEDNRRELAEAQTEIDRLVADYNRGDTGLRVNAACPSNHMPDTATDTGVVTGGTAELTAEAGQDYYALRREIKQAERQIIGLQEYTKQLYLQCGGGNDG